MTRETAILIQDERLELSAESVESCLFELDRHPGFTIPEGSLEVAFVDEASCSALHRDFFDDPELTDVMTFPGDSQDNHAGDIAICPAVAVDAARDSSLPLDEELTLYLVHGWLHLAGLRDDEPDARENMRKAEAILTAHLRSRNALLACKWTP